MAKTLTEMCTTIVVAQAKCCPLTPEEMSDSVQQIFLTLHDLYRSEQEKTTPLLMSASPETSIQQDHVLCLECGLTFTLLSNRHLVTHGLTPREYKRKHGLRMTQSLSARTLTAKRRRQARARGMGLQLAAWRAKRKQRIG